MTREENKQRIKNETLNKIIKIYHPLNKEQYSNYEEDGSYAEQRDSMVQFELAKMEKELKKLK